MFSWRLPRPRYAAYRTATRIDRFGPAAGSDPIQRQVDVVAEELRYPGSSRRLNITVRDGGRPGSAAGSTGEVASHDQ